MSRAYRIRVRESLQRVLRAGDHVGTQLELLEILPPAEMAGLLADALAAEGFEERGGEMVRRSGGVVVRVAPQSGTVTVESEAEHCVALEADRQGYVYEETDARRRKQVEDDLRRDAQSRLEQEARQREEELQRQVTDRLERELADVQGQLARVVNRVTAEALKRKAAQLGEIRQVTEDPESGSMTIVLEV